MAAPVQHYGPPQHGTLSGYVRLKCRQECCRAASRVYEKRRRGRGELRRVPVNEVREHLLYLRSRGVGRLAIARVAGVNETTIASIVQGKRERVHQEVARRLLAVTPFTGVTRNSIVSGTITRRLACRLLSHWDISVAELQRRLDLSPNTLHQLLRRSGRGVRVRTALRVWSAARLHLTNVPGNPW
jgi:plasmid maintenance system antidote protein VapI